MPKKVSAFGFMLLFVMVALCVSSAPAQAEETPADRVTVMYSHRTQRCPTCQKMGGYSEEAVKAGFKDELEAKSISFHSIDFQDSKNARFAQAYKITGPSLVIAQVRDGKVVKWTNLKEIWSKVTDKEAFLAYVQTNVKSYME